MLDGAAHAINFSHPRELAHLIRLFMADKPIVDDPDSPGPRDRLRDPSRHPSATPHDARRRPKAGFLSEFYASIRRRAAKTTSRTTAPSTTRSSSIWVAVTSRASAVKGSRTAETDRGEDRHGEVERCLVVQQLGEVPGSDDRER